MTVRRDEAGTILLVGTCPVDEAETLLRLLQETPGAAIDCSGAERLHSAIVQLLIGAGPTGACGDAFVARWIGEAVEAPL